MTNTTSHDPVPTLRQRFVEDMNLHRLSRATQHNYLRDVTRFAHWLGRPPDLATDEDLRRCQIEQRETGLGAPAMNMAVPPKRLGSEVAETAADVREPSAAGLQILRERMKR